MNQYKGECLCGACRYVISGSEPSFMYLCHCSRCRKETGSIHAATVFFKDAKLKWEKGEDNITHFALKNTRKQRVFCKTCGCALPRLEDGNFTVLPAGTLDNNTELEPTAHIFYGSRASWEDKMNTLSRFDMLPE